VSFLTKIGRYELSGLLRISSSMSQRLWNSDEPIARLHKIDSSRFVSRALKTVGSTYLTPWFLVDLSYYAIVASNDFNRAQPNEQDFLSLYNDYLAYDEHLTTSRYEGHAPEDRLFYILFGLSQKTFWFQERHRLASMHSRFYDILHELPKRHMELPLFSFLIEAKYGCDFRAYNMACLALMWIAVNNISINFPYNIGAEISKMGIDNQLLNTLLEDYITEYGIIRKSTLQARELYLTPVVRTSQGELIVSNAFLVARKALTNLYWETRFLYREAEGKELNLILGWAFELYVDELLCHFLSSSNYERIKPSDKKKRADLLIHTKNYDIIVEQKFAMLNISQQDVIFDLAKVDAWLESYVRAASQLVQTESFLGLHNRTVLKLILFFDNLYIADGLVKDRIMVILKRTQSPDLSLDNIFMIGIEEFERMVQLMAEDEISLEKVFQEKLRRQKSRDYSKGVEFSQIMDELSVPQSTYARSRSPF